MNTVKIDQTQALWVLRTNKELLWWWRTADQSSRTGGSPQPPDYIEHTPGRLYKHGDVNNRGSESCGIRKTHQCLLYNKRSLREKNGPVNIFSVWFHHKTVEVYSIKTKGLQLSVNDYSPRQFKALQNNSFVRLKQ